MLFRSDAIYDDPIQHVLVRHEENAAFAASGYARTTGKVGVCCATSGPGATNLTTGLVDAMMDSIPMVALTGQVTSTLIGTDAFQEADPFGITRTCTKHHLLVQRADELEARSLALVAFGTGVGGFPLEDAARIEVEAVDRHLAAGSSLERIVFAVRGGEAREAFEAAVTLAGL